MDSLNLNKHISGQFNAELESIRTQVMTMGGMVEQQLVPAPPRRMALRPCLSR